MQVSTKICHVYVISEVIVNLRYTVQADPKKDVSTNKCPTQPR